MMHKSSLTWIQPPLAPKVSDMFLQFNIRGKTKLENTSYLKISITLCIQTITCYCNTLLVIFPLGMIVFSTASRFALFARTQTIKQQKFIHKDQKEIVNHFCAESERSWVCYTKKKKLTRLRFTPVLECSTYKITAILA